MSDIYKLKKDSSDIVTKEARQSLIFNRRNLIICLIVVVLFALFLGVGGSSAGVDIIPEATRFGVQGADERVWYFAYDAIERLELGETLSGFEKGTQLDGTENEKYLSGTYENDRFGQYQLHVFTKINKYILVQTKDLTVVFNYESDDTTEAMYNSLCEYAHAQ